MMRPCFVIVLFCFSILPANAQLRERESYHSPYEVKFKNEKSALISDIETGERGDGHLSSSIPHKDWYSEKVREKWRAWGPPVKHFPAAKIAEGKSADWQRERLVAVGLRYVGIDYQHHHLPDWDPPADWPWKEVGSGKNGRGLDCSNYTTFCYQMAFGIKLSSDIDAQAKKLEYLSPDKKELKAERIEIPTTYADFSKTLKTGDLLFIKGAPDKEVTHVVIWIGKIGSSPGDVPLILDSHGQGVKDSNKVSIPAGVQLRPFGEKSWYFKSASHAHRVIIDE